VVKKQFPDAVTENQQETVAAVESFLTEFQTSINVVLDRGLFLPEERRQYHELLMHLVGSIGEGLYFRGLRNGMVAADYGLQLSDMLPSSPPFAVIQGGKKDEYTWSRTEIRR